MNATEAIDLTARITTPENIQFEYRIAGPFRRLPALVLDLFIRICFFIALIIAVTCSGILSGIPGGGAIMAVILLVGYFLLDWFYGLFFESYWNGKTPGKWLTKIRVISIDGRPINLYQSALRNMLRTGDMAPMVSLEVFAPEAPPMYWIPTFLVALICMTVTKRFQRLGDLAAGTMVIVDERAWVPSKVKLEDPRIASLSQFIPASFRMSGTMARAIALYAERRDRMPIPRRAELAGYLAKPLLKQFDFRDDTDADLLLCALYYREFVSNESSSSEASGILRAPPPRRSGGATPSPLNPPATHATAASEQSVPPVIPVAMIVESDPVPATASIVTSSVVTKGLNTEDLDEVQVVDDIEVISDPNSTQFNAQPDRPSA